MRVKMRIASTFVTDFARKQIVTDVTYLTNYNVKYG